MDLGGGNYSYLGLVLTNAEYTSILNMVLFIPPQYSLPLTISQNTIPIQVLELKEANSKQKRLYLEWKNVEKALLRYI